MLYVCIIYSILQHLSLVFLCSLFDVLDIFGYQTLLNSLRIRRSNSRRDGWEMSLEIKLTYLFQLYISKRNCACSRFVFPASRAIVITCSLYVHLVSYRDSSLRHVTVCKLSMWLFVVSVSVRLLFCRAVGFVRHS